MPARRPEELMGLFVAGVNAHDLDALMELYEPEAVGVDLEGQPLRGTAAMREFLSGFLAAAQHLEGQTRKVHSAGDIALTSSSWRAIVATPDGKTVTTEGTTAEVVRRQPDGSWRYAIDDPAFER